MRVIIFLGLLSAALASPFGNPVALAADPRIDSISPTAVTGAPLPTRTPFTVHGANFVVGATVRVAWNNDTSTPTNIPSTYTAVASSTQINFTVATGTDTDIWRVRIVNPDGKQSNGINFTVGPPQISSPGSTSSPGPSESDLTPSFTWAAVSGATGYGLYIRDITTDILIYNNPGGSKTGTSFTLPSGYLSNNGHSFRWAMTSIHSSGESGQSSYRYFSTPALPVTPNAPSGLVAFATEDLVSLAWYDNSSNETGFKIERKTGSGGSYSQKGTTGQSVAAYNDSSISPGNTYYYRVRAYNGAGDSSYSNEFSITPQRAPDITSVSPDPVIGSASQQIIAINGSYFVNKPTIKLTWTGQSDYTVPPAQVTYLNSSQLQMAITVLNTADNWTVRATNPDGQESNTFGFQVVVPPATPGYMEAQAFSNRVELGWTDTSTNESGFKIERRTGGGAYSQIASPGANSGSAAYYTDNSTSPRTTYTYRVRAFNVAGNSGYNNEVAATTPGGPPGAFTLSNDPPVWDASIPGPKVQLNWTPSTDVGNYSLYRNGSVYVAGIAGTSYLNSANLIGGATYTYFVRASNADGTTDSNTVSVTMPDAPITQPPPVPSPSAPGDANGPGSTLTSLTPTLSWAAASTATGYGVYVSDLSTGSLVYIDDNVANVLLLALPAGTLQWGRPYRWNLRARNANGWSGYSSRLYFQTPAGTPTAPILVSPGSPASPGPILTNLTPELSWQKSTAATAYNVAIRDLQTLDFVYDAVLGDVSSVVVPSGRLQAGRSYRWNASATGPGGSSAYAAPLYFQTSSTPTNGPDLVPESFTVTPASVLPGGSVIPSFIIANRGLGASQATTAKLWLTSSSTPPSVTQISLYATNVPALLAGQSSGFSPAITIPASLATTGTHYLWVWVDSSGTGGQQATAQNNDRTSIALSISSSIPTTQNSPHATKGNQYRNDTGTVVAPGATVNTGTAVYFECNVSDTDGDTIRMEVELRKPPGATGAPITLVSPFTASGLRARTASSGGLAAGDYGWRYRVIDSRGAVSNWVPEGNPDFQVVTMPATNQPPVIAPDSFSLLDAAGQLLSPVNGIYQLAKGSGVRAQASVSDPENDPVTLQVRFIPEGASPDQAILRFSESVTPAASQSSKAAASGEAAVFGSWFLAVIRKAIDLLSDRYDIEFRAVDPSNNENVPWQKWTPWVSLPFAQPNKPPASTTVAPVTLSISGIANLPRGTTFEIGVAQELTLRGSAKDPENDRYQVEVAFGQSPTASFGNIIAATSPSIMSGQSFAVSFPGPTGVGSYWWAYRFRDQRGAATNWLGVTAASTADFAVVPTPLPASSLQTITRSEVLRRAKEMISFTWTPQFFDLQNLSTAHTYKAGLPYVSMPYLYGGDANRPIFTDIGLLRMTGKTIVNDYPAPGKLASSYGNDCSAFLSWAWGWAYQRREMAPGDDYNKVEGIVATSDLRDPDSLNTKRDLFLVPSVAQVEPGDGFVRNSRGDFDGPGASHVFIVERKPYRGKNPKDDTSTSDNDWVLQTLEQTADVVDDGSTVDDLNDPKKNFQAGRKLRYWNEHVLRQHYRLIKRKNILADMVADPGAVHTADLAALGSGVLQGGGTRTLDVSSQDSALAAASRTLLNSEVTSAVQLADQSSLAAVVGSDQPRKSSLRAIVNWLEVENLRRRPSGVAPPLLDMPTDPIERDTIEGAFAWRILDETDVLSDRLWPDVPVHESTFANWLNRAMSHLINRPADGQTPAMQALIEEPYRVIDGPCDANRFVTHTEARVMVGRLFEWYLGRVLVESEMDEISTARPFNDPFTVMGPVSRAELLRMIVGSLTSNAAMYPPTGTVAALADGWVDEEAKINVEYARLWQIVTVADTLNNHFVPGGQVTYATAAEWLNAARAVLDGTMAPRLTQPADSTVLHGQPLSLNVVAQAGTGAVYEWYRNGIKIGETTSPTWTGPDITTATAGDYQVVIRDNFGGVISRPFHISVSGLNYSAWLRDLLGSAYTPEIPGYGRLEIPLGDGVPNLLKFALGLTPGARAEQHLPQAMIVWLSDQPYLAVQFPRLLQPSDISYVVEASAELRSWNDVTTDLIAAQASVPVVNGLSEWVTLRLPHPIGTPGYPDYHFLRLRVVVREAPTISQQPVNSVILSGGRATLIATAQGWPAVTFQWESGPPGGPFLAIPGATGPSYTTPSLTTDTSYRLVVTNSLGSVTSTTTLVHVAPEVTSISPQNRTLLEAGETYTINVTSEFSGPWSIGNLPAWIALTPSPTNGWAQVLATAQPNQTGTRRNATFTIGGLPHTANQSGPPSGALDQTFDPNVDHNVYSIAVQSDGKTVFGGAFSAVGGAIRSRIARLNPDGGTDNSFNSTANGTVMSTSVQSDGKIMIGGFFTSVGGVTRNYIARLNIDGSLDTDFDPKANDYVYSIAMQADGKAVIGGGFTSVGGISRNYIARLRPDGTLDPDFNANINDAVQNTSVQPDGRIVISGGFTSVNGVTRNRIARLNSDGTLDDAFNPNADKFVYSTALQPDGKILIGGQLTLIAGVARNRMARLNPDGTLDVGFNPDANGYVDSIAVQADGKTVVAGGFTSMGGLPRNRIARLNSDGTVDADFNPNANQQVQNVVLQVDGKILMGGVFTSVGGVARNHIARLENDEATQSLTVPSSSSVLWLRGGTSPESLSVNFDLSTDGGGSWTPLGTATRVAGGWELTGIGLPSSGHIRARARTTGGRNNGSCGLVEAFTAFSLF